MDYEQLTRRLQSCRFASDLLCYYIYSRHLGKFGALMHNLVYVKPVVGTVNNACQYTYTNDV